VVFERFLEPGPAHPGFAFARASHDRLGLIRGDDGWVARQWEQDAACVLVTDGAHVLLDGERLALVPPAEAPAGERIVLGRLLDDPEGPVHLAVHVDRLDESEPGRTDTRTAATQLGEADAGLMVHAVGLAQWHRTHPHCARCGQPTEPAEGGHVRRCPACGAAHFPRTDPAVIMLVTDGDRALLGRQPRWPEGRFSTLAGFVEPGEALEDAVRREVMEEVGVSVGEVRYAASQAWPFPASLMVGFFAEAGSTDIVVDQHEIAEARWLTRDELAELAATEAMRMPGRLSISRWLIETWYGGELPGSW
jgi:NAD+ diphosphatase